MFRNTTKQQFVIFGQKGFLAEVSAADQEVAGTSATSLTVDGTLATDAGFLPIDHAAGSNAAAIARTTAAYRIIIKAAADDSAVNRGTNLIAQKDFVTGLAFTGNDNVGKPAAGETVELLPASWDVANTSQITIVDYANNTAGNFGYDILVNDLLWVEQVAAHASAPPFGVISSQICVPMKNFIGADQVAYAQVYWDGTALDRTVLSFRSTVGTNTRDHIILTHTAGKYKAICEMMENLANATNYDNAITVFDLDVDGNITQFDPSLGIVGCFIRSAAK